MKKRVGVTNKITSVKPYMSRNIVDRSIFIGQANRDRSVVSLDKDNLSIDRLSNDLLPKLR